MQKSKPHVPERRPSWNQMRLVRELEEQPIPPLPAFSASPDMYPRMLRCQMIHNLPLHLFVPLLSHPKGNDAFKGNLCGA